MRPPGLGHLKRKDKAALTGEPFWEQEYRSGGASSFGATSDEFRRLVRRLPRGASVLDLGCGDGRNALYLAAYGLQVTAIDISRSGIAKLRRESQAHGLQVAPVVQDMRNFAFDAPYDLIIAHGCLHLIARQDWSGLIRRMKAQTTVGGYNVVAVFTDALDPPADLQEHCLGLFKEGELFELYGDWAIEQQDSYIRCDEHGAGVRHRHPINKVVARRIRTA